MRFEWFVAQRYLRSPYRPAVLRLVTLLSVLGVAAGVATLVIALSMNTGFRETLQDRLLGVTAHISLTRPGSGGIKNYGEMARKLADLPGVRSVTPAVYQTVLLSFAGEARGVVTKGVDPERERKSDEALERVISGKLDFSPDRDGIEALLIGKQLAEEWKISPGDYVTITSPQGRLTPFGLIPRTRRFRVTGIFDSGFYDYDENWCFMTLSAAESLAGAGDLVNVLEFRLNHPERATEIAREVERAAGPGFSATTWMEENRALFRALRLEKLVTAIFIGLITFVAGLNILVVLSMTVTDKARDIAVLRSLGARREQIRKVFLWQGISIGAVGTLAGLTLGYAFSFISGSYHLIPLDPQVYAVPYVPFHPSLFDGLWITAVAMGISVAATILPARAAVGLLPVEILRFE
ncbi:MAG: ABC transporter permease [Acidobacteria bacterium Pan2503]|uniref:ABC transporter permease n=1 Tax=Candidatus Acidiferrum panamense TaxID=2741543 RepID=A0A7V8SW67_9BACT|nr:ABC transporter permease [Candidatus Acidoferrum panamensis]